MLFFLTTRLCVVNFIMSSCVFATSYIEKHLRLADGQFLWEGRVEILAGGRWGTVDGYLWDSRDAAVVCQQLGFWTNGK